MQWNEIVRESFQKRGNWIEKGKVEMKKADYKDVTKNTDKRK